MFRKVEPQLSDIKRILRQDKATLKTTSPTVVWLHMQQDGTGSPSFDRLNNTTLIDCHYHQATGGQWDLNLQ